MPVGKEQSTNQQLDKFKAAARDLDCNEDEAAFKRSLRTIAKAPVEKRAGKDKAPEKPK